MSKFKRFIVLTICLLLVNSYAKADDLTYRMNITDGESLLIKENLVSEKDYSNMPVNVLKDTNGNLTMIYSGILGGFADGAYKKIDFSKIDYLMVFDWKSMENEAMYIIPTSGQTEFSIDKNSNNAEKENTISLNSSFSSAAIKTNMSLMYDDKYYENILLPGKILNIPISVTNSGTEATVIVPYIAQYDLNGKLLSLKRCEEINARKNQTVEKSILWRFDNTTECTAKIFIWQKSTMLPIAKGIQLTVQNQDFYADSYEQAQKIEIEKNICGIIDAEDDVDIVKFTPKATGVYALQLNASTDTVCGLYDANEKLLNSVSAVSEKNYLLYSLTKNQDYYIRFNSKSHSSYEIAPSQPSEINVLAKNLGIENNLFSEDEYNVYKFTPETSGEYIITAVGCINVGANLFNTSFEKVAVSDNSDSNVSFKIKSNMEANQPYYIVVYPKNETMVGSYTIYVEEPFDVISVR